MRPPCPLRRVFLFTDVEGSTQMWERYPDAMKVAIARQDAILRQAIEAQGGRVFKTVGDGFCAVFATGPAALRAALAAQRVLLTEEWGGAGRAAGAGGGPRRRCTCEESASSLFRR